MPRYDLISLLDDLGISYSTSGKHSRPGWVNVECPLCSGNPGEHLGFNLRRGYCHCWRCGWHPLEEILQVLTHQSKGDIRRLLKQYEGEPGLEEDRRSELKSGVLELAFPGGTGPLQDLHRRYLIGRGFDPDQLIQEWNLLGTGPFSLSPITGADYKFRIIIPIHHRGELVSYQGRDVTGMSELKYKACPKEEEVIHHKHLLYALDQVQGERVLVLEGATDVWRIGKGSVGTFGIEWTREQLALLCRFKRVFIMFDPEEQAQEQAEELAWQLPSSSVGIILEQGDPGEMDERDVVSLRKDLRI